MLKVYSLFARSIRSFKWKHTVWLIFKTVYFQVRTVNFQLILYTIKDRILYITPTHFFRWSAQSPLLLPLLPPHIVNQLLETLLQLRDPRTIWSIGQEFPSLAVRWPICSGPWIPVTVIGGDIVAPQYSLGRIEIQEPEDVGGNFKKARRQAKKAERQANKELIL